MKFCKDIDKPEDMFGGAMLDPTSTLVVSATGMEPANKSNFFGTSTRGLNVMDTEINISNDPNDIE